MASPGGVPMPGPKAGYRDILERSIRKRRYELHCLELKRRGIDPDWIGSHEVEPVCCTGCGKQIPWGILKGYHQ